MDVERYIENAIYVVVEKGGEKQFFPRPKSNSLMTIIKRANEQNLSLEEIEKKAGVDKGTMIKAISNNGILSNIDGFNLFNATL
ncbi:MAG: hypothetical protein WCI91_01170 [Candidatus Nomurabacteria bacterium]